MDRRGFITILIASLAWATIIVAIVHLITEVRTP